MEPYRGRILCVDADASSLQWMRSCIAGAGIAGEVASVASGRRAFDLLAEYEYDLCITDYALPDMTGVQLCGLLRQIGCDVPVMFFTAMNRQVDREMAARAGADEYLCRPDDIDIFPAAAARLLKKRRPIFIPPVNVMPFAKAA